jgi:hypothetical protein
MGLFFERTLADAWRQFWAENIKATALGKERNPVRRTPKRRVRQEDFNCDGHEIRGLEQSLETQPRWAQMTPSGQLRLQLNPLRERGSSRTRFPVAA